MVRRLLTATKRIESGYGRQIQSFAMGTMRISSFEEYTYVLSLQGS